MAHEVVESWESSEILLYLQANSSNSSSQSSSICTGSPSHNSHQMIQILPGNTAQVVGCHRIGAQL